MHKRDLQYFHVLNVQGNKPRFLQEVINLPVAPQIDSTHACMLTINRFQTVSSSVMTDHMLKHSCQTVPKNMPQILRHTHTAHDICVLQDDLNHALIKEWRMGVQTDHIISATSYHDTTEAKLSGSEHRPVSNSWQLLIVDNLD